MCPSGVLRELCDNKKKLFVRLVMISCSWLSALRIVCELQLFWIREGLLCREVLQIYI